MRLPLLGSISFFAALLTLAGYGCNDVAYECEPSHACTCVEDSSLRLTFGSPPRAH